MPRRGTNSHLARCSIKRINSAYCNGRGLDGLLLARPRVVILDEATAHLDSESEAAVQAALAEALSGRTALVIAHRLSTIRAAGQILVIEDGRVGERGTHDELLASGGRYAQLHRTQFALV